MTWILVLAGFYLAVLGFAVWISLHPFRTPIFLSPGSMMAPQEDFEVTNTDGFPIRGWEVRHENPRGIAILAHGYMMNRAELTPLAVWLHAQGWSSYIVDLRAHGRSAGKRSTFGVRERIDLEAVADLARTSRPGLPVVLIGSSMGAAASAFAASEKPAWVQGLVLDSAYSQLPRAVLGWWYFLGGAPLRFLLAPTVLAAAPFVGFNPFRVDVARSLERTRCPVLLLHGDADTLAEPRQARRNLEACGDRGTLVWLPGCGHSEGRWIHPQTYHTALRDFLAQVAASSVQEAAPA
jgi:uncharacterized protein